MTSRPTEIGKPPLLSREMRLVLVLLLLLALLGGWFVWTSNREAAALAEASAPTPTSDPPTGGEGDPSAGVAAAPSTAEDPAAPAPVERGDELEVPQIPAFGSGDAPEEADPADAVPTPGGINPDIPLAALPGRNPFRPLTLEASGNGSAPASPVASAPADTGTAPASDPAPIPSGGSGGALALAPLPGSRPQATGRATGGSSAAAASGGSAGATPAPAAQPAGALPTPTLPGAGGVSVTRPAPAPSPSVTAPSVTPPPTASTPRTRRPSAAATPSPAAPAASRPAGESTGRVTGTVPAAPRPAPAPVAGVSVPRDPVASGLSTLPSTALPAPAGVAVPAPALPQPVTQLGLEGEAGTGTASPLVTLVQTRALAFDAAVLGPVNTAIFRSKDGYVVVSQGQTLPDSDAVVREVRASGVTLELGGETLDLGAAGQEEEASPTGLHESRPIVIVRQPADTLPVWGDLAVITEFDAAQTDSPADPRPPLALAAPTPDLSRDPGEP